MLGARDFLLFFAVGCAFAQTAGTGVIGGVVIDNASGDPVRKAIVTVTWHGDPRSWATARTGSDGRFRVEGLPAGNYDVRAQKQGVGTAVYGADRIGETGELISLEDGKTRDDLVLRFVHAASISGRVVDSEGDPLGASVTLYRQGRNLGEKVLVHAGNAQTNDRGEFKLNNVQPGHYYLSAEAGQQCCDMSMMVDSAYYGDKSNWKESTVVPVRDGENLTGIDFHLTKQTMVTVHGHVRGLPLRDPVRQDPSVSIPNAETAQITVTAIDGATPFNMGTSANGADAEFRLNLRAGRYRLDAISPTGKTTYAGSQIIDVHPGTGDVDLPVAQVGDLKGRLKIEGGTAQQLSSIQITLGRAPQPSRSISAHAAADGSFTLEQVPPGEWALNLTPMPRGSYLKSAMLGDKDVRFERFTIETGSDAALNIVISTNTASIHGEVSGRAGILLAPTGKYHDLARFYFSVGSGDDGKFKMMGIAPGRYKVFALERMAAANFRSPESAEALDVFTEGDAEEIELAEGSSLEVHPKMIPFDRLKEVLP